MNEYINIKCKCYFLFCISLLLRLSIFCALFSQPLASAFSTEMNIKINYQQKLATADKFRTSKRKEFNIIIEELKGEYQYFTEQQKFYYLYLKGYKKIIVGDLKEGISLLDEVIGQSKYSFLRHRAITTKFNVYTYNEN